RFLVTVAPEAEPAQQAPPAKSAMNLANRDLEEPGAQRTRILEIVELLEQGGEAFLHHVLGLVEIAQHAAHGAKERAEVAPHQEVLRIAVTLARAGHELG